METQPKYTDGQYHIEWMMHEYFGGYQEPAWTLVNCYGEVCRKNGITMSYNNEEAAQKSCDKANQCPDGGIITNFT